MSYTWFKLHHDLPGDIKLRRFTPQEKWAWVALLCLASQSHERGVITADDEDIADYCEFSTTQDWLYYRDKLIAKGMAEIGPDGNLHILHWEQRQYDKPSDRPEAVRERVKRHREKKKNADVTPCNADVTPQIRLDPDKTRSEEKREEGEETANAAPAPTVEVEILEPEPSHEPQAEMLASLVTQGKGCGRERESGVGAKSSAAARRPKINAEQWIETYNRHKPDKWATCAAMNEKRSKAIAKAVEAVGEEKALELLAAGLSHLRVSPDAWWRDKAMGIDNALANLRFIGWGEAGLSAGLNPQAVAESGLTDSQIQSARRQKEAAGSRVVQIMEESRRKREEAAAALRARALPFN